MISCVCHRGVKLCIVKEEKRKSSTSEQISANVAIITRKLSHDFCMSVKLDLHSYSTLTANVPGESVEELEEET